MSSEKASPVDIKLFQFGKQQCKEKQPLPIIA